MARMNISVLQGDRKWVLQKCEVSYLGRRHRGSTADRQEGDHGLACLMRICGLMRDGGRNVQNQPGPRAAMVRL